MDLNTFSQPGQLERNSFLWSEVRLVVAAVALFIGGTPPALAWNPIPGMYGTILSLLKVAWLISGVASAYLLWRWHTGGQKLFGTKDSQDKAAFLVSVLSGINLGLVGLIGSNIGMTIVSGRGIFAVVGALYIAAAWHLYARWKAHGERLF